MSRSRNTGFVVDLHPTHPQRTRLAGRKPRRICWCRMCDLCRNDHSKRRDKLERVARDELRAA